jgi:hypothetical protein
MYIRPRGASLADHRVQTASAKVAEMLKNARNLDRPRTDPSD